MSREQAEQREAFEAPLRVFSKGPWLFEETGQQFSGEDLDEAAFVKYRERIAALTAENERRLAELNQVAVQLSMAQSRIATLARDLDAALALNRTLAEQRDDMAAEAQTARGERNTGRLTLDTDQRVFFYEQEFYVLSNFSAFCLYWRGLRFDTSEAAYQWSKFDHALESTAAASSRDVRADIHAAPSAHEAFKIAERNKHLRRVDWDAVKVNVMRNILCEKVRQHEYVRRKLLETGDRELIENSWRDDFWGWGPNRDGQNMLGKLWMEVRAILQSRKGEA